MPGHLSSLYVKSLLQILEDMSYPLDRALQIGELANNDLLNIKYRISDAQMTAIFEDAADYLDVPDIGLQVGYRFRVHTFSETGSILAHTSTIAEAVLINREYEPLVETVGLSSLEREPDGDYMVWTPYGDSLDHNHNAHIADLIVTGYAMTTHWLAWSLRGGLEAAGFRHDTPVNTENYDRIFQCPVSFGCERDFIKFSPTLIDQALPSAKKTLSPNPWG